VHWDLACERLTVDQLWQLRRWTDWQLAATNARLEQERAVGASEVEPLRLPHPREQPAAET
jgi:hypothetical protein